MPFAEPLWIIAGLFFCLALHFLNLHLQKRRQAALQDFAAKTLLGRLTRNVSTPKRQLKYILLLGVFSACFLALARPQYGHHWIDVKRKGIDILFAVDTSTSMLVEDIRPNRLERAKLAILDFVKQLDGDRVGLLPFAGQAFLMCPLTLDYAAFEESLQTLDTSVIPDRGTNLAHAIQTADTVLRNDANHKLLILITDGENLQGDAIQAAEYAATRNMTIFTIGVGTRQGELIPLGENGSEGFVKDKNGKFVLSRLDEQTLEEIAAATRGLYAPLGSNAQGLQTIYRQKLSLIPKEELAEKRRKVPIERFPWFIGMALVLLLVEYLLGDRKTTSSPAPGLSKWFTGTGLLLIFLCSTIMTKPHFSQASPGEEAYLQHDFLTASTYYENGLQHDPDNPVLHYNHGTAAYKNNLYDQAIASFDKALQSSDLALQEKAYYNRGNAQFKQGEESLQVDPGRTVSFWENAVKSYQGALQLQPDNMKARANLDLVQKKLDELRQQEQHNNGKDRNSNGEAEENRENGDEQGKGNPTAEQNDRPESHQDDSDTSERHGENDSAADPQQQQGEGQPRQPDSLDEGDDDTMAQQSIQQEAGKMSREEAHQLLEAMRNEEGVFSLIEAEPGTTPSTQGRDW